MTWFRCIGNNGGGGGEEIIKGVPAIASTAAQWLALPYYNDDNPIIEFKFLQPYNVNQSIIMGDMWDLNAFCFYMESDGYNYFRYNNVYENMYQIPQKLWKWVNIRIDYATSKVTVDGVDYTNSSPKTQLHYPIYLFGLPNSHLSCIAITDFKVYINGVLDMQLEARKDESTGVGYFYDTVGNQSYYSSSSTPLYYTEIAETTDLEPLYTLGAGSQWESFDNPNVDEPLIVEDTLTNTYGSSYPTNMVKRTTVDVSTLPDRSQGDVYTTIGKTSNGTPINMAKTASDDKLWISTNGSFATNEIIRVCKQTTIEPLTPSLDLRYSSGTVGTETYTITENAKYMIINGWSWQNGRDINKGVTTLPSGVTPIIDEEIINTSTFGYRLTVADLQIGDTVTMTNYNAGWVANTKLIYKLNNINPTSLIHQTTAGDGWIDVPSITGSGKALFIGACCGKTTSNIQDTSTSNLNPDDDFMLAGYTNTNFLFRIAYCSIPNMPYYKMYGYDGGFAGLAVIQ